MTMIDLSAEDLHGQAFSTAREWLVTNGLGGYASGTVSGISTRRYHGLLVAALSPPRGRHVLVSHVDESVTLRFLKAPLATHVFPGAVSPEGYKFLDGFSLSPLPTWRWRIGAALLERSIFMPQGQNTTIVRYTLVSAPGAVTLAVRPFCAFRDFHQHSRENSRAHIKADLARDRPGAVVLRPYSTLPAVTLIAPGVWISSADWWRDFVHDHERERGLDATEDLFTPGEFILSLAPGETAHIVATTESRFIDDPARLETRELSRLNALVTDPDPDPVVRALHVSLDAYRTHAIKPPGVISGFPWRDDNTRDTLIAFTGCYLVTRRFNEAREFITALLRSADQFLSPGRLADNPLDTPLWLFHAARRYLHYTNDHALGRELFWPSLDSLARGLCALSHSDISVGPDGLLYGGTPNAPRTWMNARINEVVFTPRDGAPVEVNALWHTAQRTLAWMARRYNLTADADRWSTSADRTRDSFRQRFWNPSTGFLNDVVGRNDTHDASVRPNALYALALPGELLSLDHCASVLQRTHDELLVPLGVRSLSPHDPRYRGHYTGDPWSRESAYHQGTAWPFLLGTYASALTRTARRSGDPDSLSIARHAVSALFSGLEKALLTYGLGHLSELLDGDLPHRHTGCFAYALSDSEALRALCEDSKNLGPDDPDDL